MLMATQVMEKPTVQTVHSRFRPRRLWMVGSCDRSSCGSRPAEVCQDQLGLQSQFQGSTAAAVVGKVAAHEHFPSILKVQGVRAPVWRRR